MAHGVLKYNTTLQTAVSEITIELCIEDWQKDKKTLNRIQEKTTWKNNQEK